jgi:hypothetical protein
MEEVMKSRWLLCLLASAAVMLSGDHAAAQGSTLLVDNFTKDTRLKTGLWTKNSTFLNSLAAASSSPPALFIVPQLSFSSESGMQMSGPTEDYQTTGVQSHKTFTPPFTVVAYVTPTQGNSGYLRDLSGHLRPYPIHHRNRQRESDLRWNVGRWS